MVGFLFEEIHEDEVESKRREILDGIAADIGGLGVIEGEELVRDVCDDECRVDLVQLAFDGTH